MKNKKNRQAIAVLTGDIVGSTSIPDEEYEDLLYTLHNQLSDICNQHQHNEHQVMRGDSFQIIIHDPENSALYALLLRTSLKERSSYFDCRISIGIGIGDNDVIRHTVGNSTGEVFSHSGRALDLMKNETLIITSSNNSFNEHFSLLTKYIDRQVSEMTERQCAIAYLKLKDKTLKHIDIANLLKTKRESVSRSIKAAKLDLLEEYVLLFDKKVTEQFI
jgi:hypothetical protein